MWHGLERIYLLWGTVDDRWSTMQCLCFSCAPRFLFRKVTQETGFQRPSFAGGVLSRLPPPAEQMSSATLRGACGRTAPKFFFFFWFRIYRVAETISTTHPVRIIHWGGSCLWVIPSGVNDKQAAAAARNKSVTPRGDDGEQGTPALQDRGGGRHAVWQDGAPPRLCQGLVSRGEAASFSWDAASEWRTEVTETKGAP